MKAPKCRICLEAHWGLCPTSSRGREIAAAAVKDGQRTTVLSAQASVPVGVASNPREAKFDRVAYQREYMRDYRKRQADKRTKDAT